MLKWQFWLCQKLSLKGEIDFVGYLRVFAMIYIGYGASGARVEN